MIQIDRHRWSRIAYRFDRQLPPPWGCSSLWITSDT